MLPSPTPLLVWLSCVGPASSVFGAMLKCNKSHCIEVSVNNGLNGKPLWLILNGKVLAFTADPTQPTGAMPYQWLVDNVGGKDATLVWARGLVLTLCTLIFHSLHLCTCGCTIV
jgi:hypothetical protein